MEINRENLKKAETWIFLAPVILLVVALVSTYYARDAKASVQAKVRIAKNVVANANEILEISRNNMVSLTGTTNKAKFETIESMKQCAQIARIPESNIPAISGEKGKVQKDGREVFRERVELNDIRMEQIGLFIDYAEANFEALRCTEIAITPSANKSAKDSWNTILQFEHIE